MRFGICWLAAVLIGWYACAEEAPPPDFSQPLSLTQCIAVAVERHPGVRVAQAGVESARHRLTESKSSLYPTLNFNSNWSRFQSSRQGFVIGQAGASENREVSVNADYLFLDSGQRKTTIHQTAANAGASTASLLATRQDIALGVVQAYYELLASQHLREVRQKVVDSAAQHVAQAEAGVEAGTKARIDILRAKTELANANVDLIVAEGAIRRARASLRNAMGVAENVPLQVQDEAQLPAPEVKLADAQAEALKARPELQQQAFSVLSSRESLRSAKIGAGPALSLTGGLDKYFDSSRNVTREWVLRATVSYPLFDAKQSRARVQSAKADLTARQQQREQERQQILLEVERAWIALDEAKARIEAANVAREQADENLLLNEASYQEEVATMVEVIDARAAAAQAETNQIQALYDFNLAIMTLRYALGRDLQEAGN